MRFRTLSSLFFALAAVAGAADSQVTYTKYVAPILQKHCQSCHRAGEIGPMQLTTYDEVRPWAKSIRQAVLRKTMPPWHADSRYGHFLNDRSLEPREIQAILDWVDQGAPRGNPADAPPPKEFTDGWQIGKPDLIFEMPKEFQVPPSGVVDYKWIKIPSGFTEDKWVVACEIRPGNRSVVHHAVVYAREPEVPYAKDAPYGEFFELTRESFRGLSRKNKMISAEWEPEHLQVYAPGSNPIQLGPGQARLVRAGADIIFEMHYTPNGKPQTDRTQVGLIFAQAPPKERIKEFRTGRADLAIPPGEPNHVLGSRIEVMKDLKLVAFMPHMHLRGKSMEFSAIYPDGRTEVLLSVPRYQFQWQMTYHLKEPKPLPKRTILVCKAAYDNSPNNPHNPDPKAIVKNGRQSWEEMMAGFFDVAIEPAAEVGEVFRDVPVVPGAEPRVE
jgi:hypothetical protein